MIKSEINNNNFMNSHKINYQIINKLKPWIQISLPPPIISPTNHTMPKRNPPKENPQTETSQIPFISHQLLETKQNPPIQKKKKKIP